MSLDYTKVTHESMLTDWNNRVLSDEQYKNLSQASIYSYLQEFIAGVLDLTNFYIQRTAEENYLDTAKLDSSVIKLCHNLGYQPKRPVPAVANISLNLNGPLPSTVQAGDTIWLNNENLTFTFNGHDFFLDACYSYKLTADDVRNGVGNSSWSKKIVYAVNGYESDNDGYLTLAGKVSSAAASKLRNIKVVQGKRVSKTIDPVTFASQVGHKDQFYDIDDLKFSNYYGVRDPFAFKNGEYEPRYGLCKIGIGKSLEEAMTDENIFYIEDEAVELYKENEVKRQKENPPYNVVCIRSNYDKTVRLYFGNGIDTVEGLKSLDDMIFVQYVITDGSDANYPDAVGSVLRPEGKIYASGEGRVVNITNNVQFMFESAIHGGTDFESKESMIRNAKLYFASNGKLITYPDFQSYLLTITDPLIVKHAIAFGENQLEDEGVEHDAGITNLVLYSILSDIYREADGLYRPINVFDEDEDITNTCMYIDYQTYMDHLLDFVEFLVHPKRMTYDQYNDGSVFGQWCEQIRADAEDRMMLNTKLISMPPLFHYYDVVGDILVDRHVDMAKFKDELENSIYKWLARNTGFKERIFKSDIVNLILQNPSAKRANIDIKVSDWIKGENKSYRFEPGYIRSNRNILIVPMHDIRGTDMRDVFSDMVGKDFTVTIQSDNPSSNTYRIEEVSVDPDAVYLSLNANPSISSSYYMDLEIEDDSLFKKGKISGLDTSFLQVVNDWILGRELVVGTEDRPIELPYEIDFETEPPDGVKTLFMYYEALKFLVAVGVPKDVAFRSLYQAGITDEVIKQLDEYYSAKQIRVETFSRRGANSTDITKNLSEQSFYYELKKALDSGKISDEVARENFAYLYPILKVVFDDNILDDNNNIVNFSSMRDIPVLRLRFRYKYA